jgi:hypothetical protein
MFADTLCELEFTAIAERMIAFEISYAIVVQENLQKAERQQSARSGCRPMTAFW